MTIRAVRGNNPGNLNAGDHWQGLMPRAQMTPEQIAEHRFAVFAAPKWGFRAMAIVMINYERRHGLHTVRQIISRWAPPVENATAAYIKCVCERMQVGPDTPLDILKPTVLQSLCKAISTQEVGDWAFQNHDLVAGVSLALDGHA